jgi:hypothetical protein
MSSAEHSRLEHHLRLAWNSSPGFQKLVRDKGQVVLLVDVWYVKFALFEDK